MLFLMADTMSRMPCGVFGEQGQRGGRLTVKTHSGHPIECATMRVTSGKVVSGHIVVEGEPLPDGAVVTVLARDTDESFELDATAADRGELIPVDEVLRSFRDAD